MSDFNKDIIEGFMKKAQEIGLSPEQAQAFLQQNLNVKTAEQQLDEVINGICKQAGVQRDAKVNAYVESVLKTAIDKGCTDEQAIEIAKVATTKQAQSFTKMSPIPNNTKAAPAGNTKISAYAEGFMKAAMAIGYTEGQSLDMCKLAVAKLQPKEKRANGLGLPPELLQQLMASMQQNPTAAGAGMGGLAGAGLGAGIGGMAGGGKGALAGGAAGAGLGAGAGALGGQDIMSLFHQMPQGAQ